MIVSSLYILRANSYYFLYMRYDCAHGGASGGYSVFRTMEIDKKGGVQSYTALCAMFLNSNGR